MSDTPRHSVSVAAAIFDDSGENVLLIKRRDNGRWEPPGGVLELEEAIEAGLRREVREETGAEIEVGALTGVYKNLALGIVALVFRCSVSSAVQTETTEASDVRWHRLSGIADLMPPAYALRVLDASQVRTSVAVRQHDGTNMLDTTGGPIDQH